MSGTTSSDSLPDLQTLVVTVEEIRITLGPSEEHWRKASFMTWKELPESFDAAFGEGEIAVANALPLRAMVRTMYNERRRMQKFEEPYTDYMVGETGIGKKVRRTVTIALRYHGDPHFNLPPDTPTKTTIESGVTRRAPRVQTHGVFSQFLPTLIGSVSGFARRPFARL